MTEHFKRLRHHKAEQKEGWRSVASSVAILLSAPLVALLLTAFIFQSYQVDGASMQATLQPNDRLIVWKAAKTWSRITGHQYVPKRGDIVVFNKHDAVDFGENSKQLIKRVIALPGERIVVKNGAVTVYNNEHPDGFQPDKTLPYGKAGIEIALGEDDMVIPDDTVFVLGDNRDNSLDSRVFGPINTKDIVGKLLVRVYPFGSAERF